MSIEGFIINGVVQKYDYNELDNEPPIGDISDLETEDKTSLVAAINEVVESGGGGEGGGGTSNYNQLSNKPKISGVTLTGNKSVSEIGAAASDVISVSDTQPSSATNVLWVKSSNAQTVQVPTVADMNIALGGKITAPSSPSSGAFLVYNGSAWVAQTLSTWQGGSY